MLLSLFLHFWQKYRQEVYYKILYGGLKTAANKVMALQAIFN
jgi:hypothetical protein